MSQENVEAFKRALEAFNCRDFDAVLEQLDPEAEWHPGVAASLGGEGTTFRGQEEVRKGLQDLVDAFEDLHLEVSEMRDLGDRVLAMGRLRAHGTESRVEEWMGHRDYKTTSIYAHYAPDPSQGGRWPSRFRSTAQKWP